MTNKVVGGGHIIPLRQITQFEQALPEIINRSYKPNERSPKIAIITAQNNRAAQISTTLEQQFPYCSSPSQNQVMDKRFSLYKSQVIKKSNIAIGSDQWLQNFRDYDLFLFLPKIFQDHLMHRDFRINDFDIIIFDELHNCQVADHLYNQIMTEFYFNNENINDLPLVLGMISFEILFKQEDQLAQIHNSLKFYTNMLNSRLMAINDEEAIQIMKIYQSKLTINNRVSLQKPFLRFNTHNEILRFVKTMAYNVVKRNDNWSFGTVFNPNLNIFALKKLDKKIMLQTKIGSKITIQDSKKLFTSIISIINNEFAAIKDIIGEKKLTLKTENSQYVDSSTKIRYFSSRILVDSLFSQFLGHILEKDEWFYSQSNFTSLQINKQGIQEKPNDLLIFKKKLESENYLYLHLCSLLYQQGFLKDNLMPNEDKISKFVKKIFNIPDAPSETKETKNQQNQKQPDQSASQSQSSKASKSTKVDSNKTHQNEYFLGRALEFKKMHEDLEKIFVEQKKNNKAQAILNYNTTKLAKIIQQVINPILNAVYEYEKRVSQVKRDQEESKEMQYNLNHLYAISWMSLENNMNSLDIEDRFLHQSEPFNQYEIAQDLNNPEVTEIAEENEFSKFFSQYTAKIFNVKNQQLLSKQKELKELSLGISSWIERMQIPIFLYQHYDFSKFVHKHEDKGIYEKQVLNRISFLKFLIIALTEHETSIQEYKLVKEEMERLAFVGDSMINTAVIINLYFKCQGGLNEKEFDKRKIATIKSSNLEQYAEEYGLQYLMLKSKYQDKNDIRPRKPSIVLQSIVGFLGIYVGFSSAYLFLHEIGLVKSNQAQKEDQTHLLKVLEELSQQYSRIIEFEKIAKSELYQQIGEKLGIDIAKSLVEFCAQQPKEYNFQKNVKSDPKYYQPNEEPMLNDIYFQEEEKKAEDSLIDNLQNQDPQDKSDSEKKNECELENQPDCVIEHSELQEKLIDKFMNVKVEPQEIIEKLTIPPSIQMQEEEKMKQSLEMQKFKHTHESILIQCFTHKSFSEKLAQKFFSEKLIQQSQRFNFSERTIKLIKQQRQAVDVAINVESLELPLLIKDFILQFNFQIYEYLGDSILNQTMAKYYYLQTALKRDQKFHGCFGAQKLHDLKTWITSNHWLASLLCEHYYSNLIYGGFEDEQLKKMHDDAKKIENKLEAYSGDNEKQMQILRKFPQMPFNIDETNTKYKEQMLKYQQTVFLHCFKNQRKIYSNTFQMEEQQKYQEQEDEENFHDQQDCFVKIFSDGIEALFGGIFIDTGDFEKTQLYILNMMQSRLFKDTPRQDQERSKVLSVWNSKKYTYQVKISHTVEEKDGQFYVRLYTGKLEIRRCKFEKDKKRKVERSYLDLRFYLENAYFKFESDWISSKNTQAPTSEDWNQFNTEYRRKYHANKSDELKKREKSIFKEACKKIQFPLSISDQASAKLSNLSTNEFKKIIIEAFKQAATIYKAEQTLVLQIENERASSSKIRDIFNLCDIRSINTLSPKCYAIDGWVNQLTKNQVDNLFNYMLTYQMQLSNPQQTDDDASVMSNNISVNSFTTRATSTR